MRTKLSLVVAALLLSTSLVSAQVNNGSAKQNGQPAQFVAGHAILAGPALPTIAFNGTITNSTNGSYTISTLTIQQSNTTSPIILPLGTTITTGATTGTTVVANLGNNNYQVVGPSNTVAAVATSTAMVGTPSFTPYFQDTLENTAPTYASGGCTAGSPAFVAGSTPFSWSFTNGSGTCTGGNTVTFTFPAAATTWMCKAASTLNPTTDIYFSTGAASTTAVVLTDYSTVGAGQNTKANDVITGTCAPH